MVNKNEIYNFNKSENIAIIGDWNSEYRSIIKNGLLNITNINHITGFDCKSR
jgi:competence protein ComGF